MKFLTIATFFSVALTAYAGSDAAPAPTPVAFGQNAAHPAAVNKAAETTMAPAPSSVAPPKDKAISTSCSTFKTSVVAPVKASSTPCTTKIPEKPKATTSCTTKLPEHTQIPVANDPKKPPPPAQGGNQVANTVQACGNGQKYSCCNTTGANNSILGGACEIPIIGQSCAAQQAMCCNANQNGLINVGSICLPIVL